MQKKSCVFPFSFQGETYNACTDAGSDNGAVWCATKVIQISMMRMLIYLKRLMLMEKLMFTPGKTVKMDVLEQVKAFCF